MNAYNNVWKTMPKKDLWIAFSGGKDSLAVAHKMKNIVSGLVHYNHGLPPDDKIKEEAIKAAKFLNLPIIINDVVPVNPKGSLEAWCRENRYAFLDKFRKDIIVAHHLGDAAESYIMNCFTGNPEYTPIKSTMKRSGYTVYRPFITTRPRDIEKYIQRNGLSKYVAKDPLNQCMSCRRNKVRKMLGDFKECGVETIVLKKFYL